MTDATPPLPPPTADLRRFVRLAGSREAAYRLIAAFGGTTIYVPHGTDRSHLVDALGVDLVDRLAAKMAGDYLKVPLGRAWRIQALRFEGRSMAEIARALGMTESGVYRSLRQAGITGNVADETSDGAGVNPEQMDLFSSPPSQG